ncbi:MAG UNVERIFIED_CONTAM: four helix bundle protein [Planctomycetaceae bacterium]|jgi:hypothetical protein
MNASTLIGSRSSELRSLIKSQNPSAVRIDTLGINGCVRRQSIPLNIAEGNGKQSLKDKNRFFEIARGSALKFAAINPDEKKQ